MILFLLKGLNFLELDGVVLRLTCLPFTLNCDDLGSIPGSYTAGCRATDTAPSSLGSVFRLFSFVLTELFLPLLFTFGNCAQGSYLFVLQKRGGGEF